MMALTETPISFLLGSGASIPAKMPKTNALTELVLSGNDVWKNTNGSYYLNKTKQSGWDVLETSRITEFVNILKQQVDIFYKNGLQQRETNYEDLYYLADQIRNTEDGDYDNPAIQPLIEKILPVCVQLMTKTDLHDEWRLLDLASEATWYIRDINEVNAMFDGDIVTVIDDRFDYGEIRYQTLGLLKHRVIMVVHTESETVIRIISARKATKYEEKIYFDQIAD